MECPKQRTLHCRQALLLTLHLWLQPLLPGASSAWSRKEVFISRVKSFAQNACEEIECESHLLLCIHRADKAPRVLAYERIIYFPGSVSLGVLFFVIAWEDCSF